MTQLELAIIGLFLLFIAYLVLVAWLSYRLFLSRGYDARAGTIIVTVFALFIPASGFILLIGLYFFLRPRP